jgi:bacillithiol system protein YtxJ
MAEVREISTIEEWETLFESSATRPVLVFKHSTTCPISADAHAQLQKHLAEEANEQVEYVLVKVIEARPVSNKIAEDVAVKHESPQAILIKEQQATWSKSHFDITRKSLTAALSNV